VDDPGNISTPAGIVLTGGYGGLAPPPFAPPPAAPIAQLPAATAGVYPDAGHSPFVESPGRCNAGLRRFARSLHGPGLIGREPR